MASENSDEFPTRNKKSPFVSVDIQLCYII